MKGQTTTTYECLGCGHLLQDDPQKDILVCPYCGTTVTKAVSEYDMSLRYLREKDAHAAAERREEQAYQRKSVRIAGWILGGFIVLGLLYMFLRDKVGLF